MTRREYLVFHYFLGSFVTISNHLLIPETWRTTRILCDYIHLVMSGIQKKKEMSGIGRGLQLLEWFSLFFCRNNKNKPTWWLILMASTPISSFLFLKAWEKDIWVKHAPSISLWQKRSPMTECAPLLYTRRTIRAPQIYKGLFWFKAWTCGTIMCFNSFI